MADNYFRHEEERRVDERAEWLVLAGIIGVAVAVVVIAFLVAWL